MEWHPRKLPFVEHQNVTLEAYSGPILQEGPETNVETLRIRIGFWGSFTVQQR